MPPPDPRTRGRSGAGVLASLLLLVLVTGCAFPGLPLERAAKEINATLRIDPLIVDVGDLIVVEFPNNTEWNQRVRVRSDGTARFLFLGDLQVKGLSEPEMVDMLTGEYTATLQDPDVVISIGEWAPRNAYLMGEVGGRGAIQITGRRMTLVEAFGRGGGHQWRTARLKRIHFIRWMPEENRYQLWKLDARVEHWDEAPIYLQPYDLIYVPPKVITLVNNWVDVYIRRNIPLPYLINRAESSLAEF